MKKIKVLMNKPIYLGFSLLEINKKLMYKFWYDCMKQKYGEKAKLCYMDTRVLLFILKLKIFMKMLHIMLKKDLTHQIIVKIDHCL